MLINNKIINMMIKVIENDNNRFIYEPSIKHLDITLIILEIILKYTTN